MHIRNADPDNRTSHCVTEHLSYTAISRLRGIQTRAYPVSDAQSNRIGLAINMRRCKESLRITSLNIGTMTRKGRELADPMKARRIDVMCLQETRWGGNKAREIGDGCKLFYSGSQWAQIRIVHFRCTPLGNLV